MMTIAELVTRAAAQQPVSVTREISVAGPSLQAAMRSHPYMTVAEMIAHPDQHKEKRSLCYGHILGPGLTGAEISAWQARFPHHRLPADVTDALTSVNGVHLWADLAIGRAYFGIAPLDEWQDLASVSWALIDERTKALVISYHANGDFVLVLDTQAGRYDWLDHEDIDNPVTVGRTFSEMLRWFWDHAQLLDPTGEWSGIPSGRQQR